MDFGMLSCCPDDPGADFLTRELVVDDRVVTMQVRTRYDTRTEIRYVCLW
jgi:hypothetical protein